MVDHDIDFLSDARDNDTVAIASGPLQQAVDRWKQAKQKLAWHEEQIKIQKAEILRLETDTIPSVLDQLGQSKGQALSGEEVKVGPFLSANIPSKSKIDDADGEEREALIQRRAAALNWLREKNCGSSISSTIIVEVGKGDNIRAVVASFLKEHGITYSEDERIHPQTLAKVLKELNHQGEEIPVDMFELYVGRKATIKQPRKRS